MNWRSCESAEEVSLTSALASHSGTCVVAASPTAKTLRKAIQEHEVLSPSAWFLVDCDSATRTPGDDIVRNLPATDAVSQPSQTSCMLCGSLRIRAFKDKASGSGKQGKLFERFFTLALTAGSPLLRYSDEASWSSDAASGKKTPMGKVTSLTYNWQALATLSTGAQLTHEAACSLTLAVETSSGPVYQELHARSALEARVWAVAISNSMGGIRERSAPRMHELDALSLAQAWDSTMEATVRPGGPSSDAAAEGDALLSPLQHAAAAAVAAAGRAGIVSSTAFPTPQPPPPAPTAGEGELPKQHTVDNPQQAERKQRPEQLVLQDSATAPAVPAAPSPPQGGDEGAGAALRGGAVFGFATAAQAQAARAARKAAADSAVVSPESRKGGAGGPSGARTAPGTARASARRPLSHRRSARRDSGGSDAAARTARPSPGGGARAVRGRRPPATGSRASSHDRGAARAVGEGASRSLVSSRQQRQARSKALRRPAPSRVTQASANPQRTPLSLRLLPLSARLVPLKLAAKALKLSPQHQLPATPWGASLLRVYDQLGLLCTLPADWLKPSVRSLGVLLLRLGDSVDTSAAMASAPQAEMARAFLGSGPSQRGARQGRSASAGRGRQHKAVVVAAVLRPGSGADAAELAGLLPVHSAPGSPKAPLPQTAGKGVLSLACRLAPHRQHLLLGLLQPTLVDAYCMSVAAAQHSGASTAGMVETPASVFHYAPSFDIGQVPPLMNPAALLPGSAGLVRATVTPEKSAGGRGGGKDGSTALSPGGAPAAAVPVGAVFDARQHSPLPLSHDTNSLYPGDILVSAGHAQLAGQAPKEVVQSMKRQLRGGGAAGTGVNIFLVRPVRVVPAQGHAEPTPTASGAVPDRGTGHTLQSVAHSRAESHVGGFRSGADDDGNSSHARDSGRRAAAQLFPAALRESLRSSITPRGSMLPPESWDGSGHTAEQAAGAVRDGSSAEGAHMTVVAAPAAPGGAPDKGANGGGGRGEQVHPAAHDSDSDGDESDSSAEGTVFTQSLPVSARHRAERASPLLAAVQFDMGVVTRRVPPAASLGEPALSGAQQPAGQSVEQAMAQAYSEASVASPDKAGSAAAAAAGMPATPPPERAQPAVYSSPLRSLKPAQLLTTPEANATGTPGARDALPLVTALRHRLQQLQAGGTGGALSDAIQCVAEAPVHMQGSAAYQLAALSVVGSPQAGADVLLRQLRDASPAKASLKMQMDELAAQMEQYGQ